MAYIEINRPISAIFADLVNQFTALVRKEGQLARAEMSEEIGEIGMALGLVVAGGAAAPSLDDSAAGGGCRLGCGGSCRRLGDGVALLIGVALLVIGVRRLKARRFVPTRTIARLQHDAAVAARQMRNDHGIPERAA